MAKPSASEVIELHLGNEFWLNGLPLHRMLRAPTAQSARSFAGEAWWFHYFFQFFCQLLTVLITNGGSKAYVVEQTFVIVKSEQ